VTTNILREAVVSIPHVETKKYLDKTEAALFLCQDEAALGVSRVSILSVAIAVRSAIAEYSRLVIAIHRRKKKTLN
jgi:hypothetical protein